MKSFIDVIQAFGGTVSFSNAIDVPYPTARAMVNRNRIDTKYWEKIETVAKQRGIEIDRYKLADIEIDCLKGLAPKPVRSGGPRRAEKASADI